MPAVEQRADVVRVHAFGTKETMAGAPAWATARACRAGGKALYGLRAQRMQMASIALAPGVDEFGRCRHADGARDVGRAASSRAGSAANRRR
jgi:hypothetical protein